jgi:hypothetical protein
MSLKLAFLIVTLGAIARAEPDAPEFLQCTSFGSDVHGFIECLSTARDEWDRKTNKLFAELIDKVDDEQRRRFYTRAKQQREQRFGRCGVPSPATIAAAECQRAMAENALAELGRTAAPFLK